MMNSYKLAQISVVVNDDIIITIAYACYNSEAAPKSVPTANMWLPQESRCHQMMMTMMTATTLRSTCRMRKNRQRGSASVCRFTR